jgi:hypothetical protein
MLPTIGKDSMLDFALSLPGVRWLGRGILSIISFGAVERVLGKIGAWSVLSFFRGHVVILCVLIAGALLLLLYDRLRFKLAWLGVALGVFPIIGLAVSSFGVGYTYHKDPYMHVEYMLRKGELNEEAISETLEVEKKKRGVKEQHDLHNAIERGANKVAKALIEQSTIGVCEARNEWGATPLGLAVIGGDNEVIGALLIKDVDVEVSSAYSRSIFSMKKLPLDIARRFKRSRAVTMLEAFYAVNNKPLPVPWWTKLLYP